MTRKMENNMRLLERAEVVARTVISQQGFYLSPSCTSNQKQALETMIGAAIWYFPQNEDLWTGLISYMALKHISESPSKKDVKLTKDHCYPRKVAAQELLRLDWDSIPNPAQEVQQRYLDKYGRFTYVTPQENKRLVPFQKTDKFTSTEDSYKQAGIEVFSVSSTLLKLMLKGDRELALSVLNGDLH